MIVARSDANIYSVNIDENATPIIENIFQLLKIDNHTTFHSSFDNLFSGNTSTAQNMVVCDTIDINFTSPNRMFKRYVVEVTVYTKREQLTQSKIGILNHNMPSGFKTKQYNVSCIKFKPFRPDGVTSDGNYKIHTTQLILNVEEKKGGYYGNNK